MKKILKAALIVLCFTVYGVVSWFMMHLVYLKTGNIELTAFACSLGFVLIGALLMVLLVKKDVKKD